MPRHTARNPFILQEAEENDQDDFEQDMDGNGEGGGEDIVDADDEDFPYDPRDVPHWRDEELVQRTDIQDIQYPLEDFTEYLKKRYVDQSPSRVIHGDEESLLTSQELRAALLDQGRHTNLFWRIKCKTGKEQDLVFNVMNWVHQDSPTPSWDKSGTGSESGTLFDCASNTILTPPHEVTPEWKAIVILEDFANDKYQTLPQVHEELRKIYGASYDEGLWQEFLGPINDREPDEPVNDDVLRKLAKRKENLVPSSATATLEPPTNHDQRPTTTAPPTNPDAVYTASSSHTRIFSAFCVPSVSNSIYLEADLGTRPQETGIVEFLRQNQFVVKSTVLHPHHKVSHSLYSVMMEPVSSREIAQLLSIQTPDIKVNSWVRVTRGTYCDDGGLVIRREISSSLRRLVILVVPRFNRTNVFTPWTPSTVVAGSKRKAVPERCPQRLFDEKQYPGEVTTLSEKHFLYRGQEFSHGLLVKVLAYSSVTTMEVDLDRTTRQLFRIAGHPAINDVAFPVPLEWVFFVEEKVEVICLEELSEEQQNNADLPRNTRRKSGVILTVEEGRCLVNLEAEDDQQWISTRNIRKCIMVGNSVIVVAGELRGKSGLVVVNNASGVLVTESSSQSAGHSFTVHPNVCQVTQVRESGAVPWLNTHVTLFVGMYAGYTGIVTDVHVPRPRYPYTSLEVYIPRLLTTISIRHDFVFDTVSQRYLQDIYPLKSNQLHFNQVSWDALLSPNVSQLPIDPETKRSITAEQVFNSLPPIPWIDKTVRVIKGNHKGAGTVKKAQRWHQSSSGIQLLIELDTWSYDKGSSPSYWFDYLDVRDPDTGLGLAERYPLRGRQRYWEPLEIAPRVKAQPIAIAVQRTQTPPPRHHDVYRDVDAWNPSSHTPLRLFMSDVPDAELNTSLDGNSPTVRTQILLDGPATSTTPSHWALDPRLDRKKYLARHEPLNGPAVPRVWAELRRETGKIWIHPESDTPWPVPASEIVDHIPRVKPTTNKKPLLVIRGEHTGKHLRQIYIRYVDQEDTPKITAAVYGPWGSVEERLLEEIEIDVNDVAEAQKDFNAAKFADDMKAMRVQARKHRQRGDKKKNKT
ncbi:hypothetical protein K435DRAFT_860914 [Dendrothele bispora CBS 962.96]|uniref:KOW domain-containing protein n=1 Tax=Dendrothele bispora (strain CBS 962.96) TaxID=1314807 RepID=A0A4S8LWR7_DENBC|nr:hypothetical protein K435DRAFT_860914 [Dendrothele bispora CBS 962.96]